MVGLLGHLQLADTHQRELCAAAAGRAAGREHPGKGSGRAVDDLTGAGVCAGLGWGAKGAQIGSCGFALCGVSCLGFPEG